MHAVCMCELFASENGERRACQENLYLHTCTMGTIYRKFIYSVCCPPPRLETLGVKGVVTAASGSAHARGEGKCV